MRSLGYATAMTALLSATSAASASPWAGPGDAQLRSDIDLLAAADVVDNITTHWPLPWASLLDDVDPENLSADLPDYVRHAATKVHNAARIGSRMHVLRAGASLDLASNPNFIRGFDALGRSEAEGRYAVDYMWSTTAVHLSATIRTTDKKDKRIVVPDGSYIAQRIDDVVLYAGVLDHWWGPGWISSLSVSNNAQAIPQVGIARAGTAPFKSPWLSWLGPWQAEFFVGVLDGPRIARNTVYSGLRFAFSPIPHLEIGMSRTDQMCGSGHQCKPLKGYFNFANNNSDVNIVNDQAAFDFRYSNTAGRWTYEIYTQLMNEDSSPIAHSGTSHLFGGSIWVPFDAGMGRLTVEYTDSVATKYLWGGGTMHGFAYNNYDYKDGMRYRGRTLGFSLDSDSRLLSIQAAFTDQQNVGYTFTLHHAEVSTGDNSAGHSYYQTYGNVVTSAPVILNMVQARVSVPFDIGGCRLRLDGEARVQDDQPRPDHGYLATAEARITIGF